MREELNDHVPHYLQHERRDHLNGTFIGIQKVERAALFLWNDEMFSGILLCVKR